jgi:hypothetical protein
MGILDLLGSKEDRLMKMKDKQDKQNRELRAEIMLMNSQKETKELQKELDDLRSEALG